MTEMKIEVFARTLSEILLPHLKVALIDELRNEIVEVVDARVHNAMATLDPIDRKLIAEVVQEKMDDLSMIDKDMIREVCLEVVEASDLDDKISDYMCNNFDIYDYESQIKEIVDVEDALEDRLPDAVQTVIDGMEFTISARTRF